MKVYDVRRMPSDGKSSLGLWPGELKMYSVSQCNLNDQTEHVQDKLKYIILNVHRI